MIKNKITALRLERQYLITKSNESEYISLYRDMQPGYNVYWNGFGDPPTLTFRADFNDLEFNRNRQFERKLLKGRFAGGNLGWIMNDDFELFACAYNKQLTNPNRKQAEILDLIKREGPLTIQQIKESTGMLVKEITPVLHRLQEAFLIYEDQYDGEWDRGWYQFKDMFPDIELNRYTRVEALKILLQRFAYRQVIFDAETAKSFYKLPIKDITAAIESLIAEDILIKTDNGYILKSDMPILENYSDNIIPCVIAIHKNDFLYRSREHLLKEPYKRDGFETMYYLLIDGEFRGAAYGKFRYGPPDFDDLRVDLPASEAAERKDEIINAVKQLSYGKAPDKYNGEISGN